MHVSLLEMLPSRGLRTQFSDSCVRCPGPPHAPVMQGTMHPLYMLLAYPGSNTPGDAAHTAIIRYMLEKGASISKGAEDGSTPLHLAAEHGLAGVVALLLDAGSDINGKRMV